MINTTMFIYCITNLINNKKYVGQTTQPTQYRWNKHKCDANNESPFHIHRAIRKYGVDNFNFEVIDESASDLDELNDLEEFYISFYDTFVGTGYNMTSGGDSFIVSDETKKKLSELRVGIIFSDEHKRNISLACIGREPSHETKVKISKKLKGRIFSDEHKRNISIKKTGQTHTIETKQKLSNTRINMQWKKVIQIDKITGEEIACWLSTTKIELELKLDSSYISKCCNGKAKSCGGFIWKYITL